MPRLQFSLRAMLWLVVVVALLFGQFATLDRIWRAFGQSELPVAQFVCLVGIWIAGYFLIVRPVA
jgi:hypothetical protein